MRPRSRYDYSPSTVEHGYTLNTGAGNGREHGHETSGTASTAAGTGCWRASAHTASNAEPKEDSDETACVPPVAAGDEGDGACESPGARLRASPGRPVQGRAAWARVRGAQPQRADARAGGRGVRAVGVQRDPLLPRGEEAPERALAVRRQGSGRRP